VHEAVRDLTRARGVAMLDLKKKRQQPLSFLLRHVGTCRVEELDEDA
jgi:hypothetical protein